MVIWGTIYFDNVCCAWLYIISFYGLELGLEFFKKKDSVYDLLIKVRIIYHCYYVQNYKILVQKNIKR